MKNQFIVLCACIVFAGLLGLSPSLEAASPTNINYSGKGSSYRLYTVRCSDGKKRIITSWNKKLMDKWCVGKAKKKKCSPSQLKAAKRACR